MTMFGKVLVFFNLAFGLLLAGWAFSLYANGIDWTDRREGKTAVGISALRADELEDLWKGVPPAQMDWLKARAKLQEAEKRLADDRVWYDDEIRHVFEGPSKDRPVGRIVLTAKPDPKSGVKAGQVVLDAKGFPQLAPLKDRAGQPLQSLEEYNKKDGEVLAALAEVLKKHEAQTREVNKYTDMINGTKEKRGYQKRIEDERAKIADIRVEEALVKPMLINTVVESELILKRKTQLEKRVDELKKFKVASK